MKIDKERAARLYCHVRHVVHTKVFHSSHALSHLAYLIVITIEYHGVVSLAEAAVIGLSFIAIVGGEEA